MKINKVKVRKLKGKNVGLDVEVEGEEEIMVFDDPDYFLEEEDGKPRFVKCIEDYEKKKKEKLKNRGKMKKDLDKENEIQEVELTQFKGVEVLKEK